jgi:hypothetical protein
MTPKLPKSISNHLKVDARDLSSSRNTQFCQTLIFYDSILNLHGFSSSRVPMDIHKPTKNIPRNHSESMSGKVMVQSTMQALQMESKSMKNRHGSCQGCPWTPKADQMSTEASQSRPRHSKNTKNYTEINPKTEL